MSKIRFLHECHVPQAVAPSVRYLPNQEVDEQLLPVEWLNGALEHEFVVRVEDVAEGEETTGAEEAPKPTPKPQPKAKAAPKPKPQPKAAVAKTATAKRPKAEPKAKEPTTETPGPDVQAADEPKPEAPAATDAPASQPN